jgi:hypothetical protein
MVTISGLVNTVIDKPIATAARAVRRALERIPPAAAQASQLPAQTRKSKGWRRHFRKAKARQAAVGIGAKV